MRERERVKRDRERDLKRKRKKDVPSIYGIFHGGISEAVMA